MNLIEATNYFLEDSENPFDLGNIEILPQTNNLGKSIPFSWYDDRILLKIKSNGKILDIYQSANGTSGKTIGTWYPYGWVVDDNKTGFSWIVKGDIPELASTMNEVNSVLPHTDDDTLEFLNTLTEQGLPRGRADVSGPEYWVRTYNLDEILSDKNIYKKIRNNQITMENDGREDSLYYILYHQWINQMQGGI